MVQLMKYVGSNTGAANTYDNTKVSNLKKVKAQADVQLKQVTEISKGIVARAKSTDKKPNTRELLEQDVTRLHSHKEMMMDWLFTEMEEHSKKLQMYSEWFDYFQRSISVEQEFQQIMKVTNIPGLADNTDYLQSKKRGAQAQSKGNEFR